MSTIAQENPTPARERTSGELYVEDFVVGQRYRSAKLTVDAAAIMAFAGAYDPQPFHLDEHAARASFFGGLAASGWHTAALTMRLLVQSGLRPAGGIIGAGADELKWPRPVRPGDEIEVESEVLEVRPSRSRPTHGFVKFRTTTSNQRGEPVQVLVMNLLVELRNAGRSAELSNVEGGKAKRTWESSMGR
jgi:acyl dehydratase